MPEEKKRGRPFSGRAGTTTTVYFDKKYLSFLKRAKPILKKSHTEMIEEALEDYADKKGLSIEDSPPTS
jgi:hypothetical protein